MRVCYDPRDIHTAFADGPPQHGMRECYYPRDIHPAFADGPPQHGMIVCFDKCYDQIALRRSIYRSMKEISSYRENRRTFPGLDDYGSGQQWFLPQPQSAWSRTELLMPSTVIRGIQQQHVTKSNTEYQLLVSAV